MTETDLAARWRALRAEECRQERVWFLATIAAEKAEERAKAAAAPRPVFVSRRAA